MNEEPKREEPKEETSKLYRIKWRSKENGTCGQSKLTYSLGEVTALVSAFNQQYRKIEHWSEEVV
jgi:hypothetical protein